MLKFIVFVALITKIGGNAISWGHIQNGQVLLFDQFFYDRDNNNQLEPRDIFFASRSITITAIHITDLTGIEGGSAEIISGGINYTFVKLKLIPERRHKLLLNVEIFGVHKNKSKFNAHRR
jgi:hypothetical protein